MALKSGECGKNVLRPCRVFNNPSISIQSWSCECRVHTYRRLISRMSYGSNISSTVRFLILFAHVWGQDNHWYACWRYFADSPLVSSVLGRWPGHGQLLVSRCGLISGQRRGLAARNGMLPWRLLAPSDCSDLETSRQITSSNLRQRRYARETFCH